MEKKFFRLYSVKLDSFVDNFYSIMTFISVPDGRKLQQGFPS